MVQAPAPRAQLVVGVAIVAWLLAIGVGFALVFQYKSTPSQADGQPPRLWPAASRIVRGPGSTLVLFAHPECPCTRASISELARLMPRLGPAVQARVVVVNPDASLHWDDGLATRAGSIPGVSVLEDDGTEAVRFQAATSGLTLLYDAEGRLAFHGGLTASRGHEGTSFGQERILALVKTGHADRADSPVFGCTLALPARNNGG